MHLGCFPPGPERPIVFLSVINLLIVRTERKNTWRNTTMCNHHSPQPIGIRRSSRFVLLALDEKHQVCKDFIQARGVLESLMAKGEASLVNLRRETISLSDAAEKKHGEFRDVQKSEMLRLRDETRLVLEMNVQSGVAPQYITATHEDRSRENADLALVEHSLKMLLSSTPIHSSLTSARRPCAWSYSPWGHFETWTRWWLQFGR